MALRVMANGARLSAGVIALSMLPWAACERPSGDAQAAGTANAGAGPVAAGGSDWFEDVTAEAGIEFQHLRATKQRLWLPEIVSGGACWLDFDGDGWLDLYLVQAAELSDDNGATATGVVPAANVLYRNLGAGRFADVTAEQRVGDRGRGMGCAVADYDGDGDPDLLVTNLGPNRLFRNDGSGFSDVTEQLGIAGDRWSTSALFLDYDGDGDLDLYVTNYIVWSPHIEPGCGDYCGPKTYNAPAADVLYRNDGAAGFTDVSYAAGIRAATGNGLGVAACDFDRDGDLDVFVANDGTPNQLWLNDGGRFVDDALLAGCAVNLHGASEAGMGVALADLDHDGAFEVFLTHLAGESNTLYVDRGRGMFEDATSQSLLAASSWAYTGFGTGFADFDLDGQIDLFVANGRVKKEGPSYGADRYAEPDLLYRGSESGLFALVEPLNAGAEVIGSGRAAAMADYDNDGDVDIVVVNNGGPARLLRNRARSGGGSGGGRTWIRFEVVSAGGREVVGARVMARFGERIRWRVAGRGYGFCSSNDPRVHFGLAGAQRVDDVRVVWPDGEASSFGPYDAGATHRLTRGQGHARREARP